MKRTYTKYTLLLAGMLWLTGCEEKALVSEGEGSVRLNVVVNDQPQLITKTGESNSQELAASSEIRFFSEKGMIRYYEGLSSIPETLNLMSGSYSVQIVAGDSVSASFDKKYYKGNQAFEVTAGVLTPVQVTCKLANVLATVDFEPTVSSIFSEYSVSVFTTQGSLSFTAADTEKTGYYMLTAEEKSLGWTFVGTTIDGKPYTRTGIVDVRGGVRYNLTFDFADADYDDGGGMISIVVNETPLEVVIDDNTIYERPNISGDGFDLNNNFLLERGLGTNTLLWIASSSKLTSALIHCEMFEQWGLPVNKFDMIKMSPADLAACEEMGLSINHKFDLGSQKSNLRITFSEELMRKISSEDGQYVVSFSAQDEQGKTRSADWNITVFSAPILTTSPDMGTVWSSKAQLNGLILHETEETLMFRYRSKDSETWSTVAAERNENKLTASLTGLKAATTYEYQVMAGEMISNVVCEFTTESELQMPNAGFENWSGSSPLLLYGSGETMFWDSGNHGSATMSKNVTTNDGSIKNSGRYSVKLESQFVGFMGIGKFAAGNLFAGKYLKTDGTDGELGWGRPFASRPTALKGYIRYVSGTVDYAYDGKISKGDSDQGIVYVALGDWSGVDYDGQKWSVVVKTKSKQFFDPADANIIAYGEKICTSSTEGEQLIEFTIPLDYRSNRKPTSLILVASASRYGDYFAGSTGSTMWLDDLEFIYE